MSEAHATETQSSVATPPLDTLVEKYIQLRDKKAEIEARHKKELEPFAAAMDRLENLFLNHLNSSGVESVRTKAGTFFKSNKTSATVADWDMALNFIREQEAWSMLEKRVSKGFVEAYKEEHNDLPPGINWRSEIAVNIRRA